MPTPHADATPYRMGFVWMICLTAAMGGLLFGYDWVVIGGAKPFYEQQFQIAASPLAQGLAMSTALVGCLCGAACSGTLTARYGRKPLLVLAALFFTCSAVTTALAPGLLTFNLARWVPTEPSGSSRPSVPRALPSSSASSQKPRTSLWSSTGSRDATPSPGSA